MEKRLGMCVGCVACANMCMRDAMVGAPQGVWVPVEQRWGVRKGHP